MVSSSFIELSVAVALSLSAVIVSNLMYAALIRIPAAPLAGSAFGGSMHGRREANHDPGSAAQALFPHPSISG
jgi:hypothetical protein